MSTATDQLVDQVAAALRRFTGWLDGFGETSYDHQSFFAGPIGRRAKALYYRRPRWGTLAVAPMIFSEAVLPSARRLFWKPQRFPIADAHYAMGFATLADVLGADAHYRRAVHFLEVLEQTRCANEEHYAWGYPFDWVTRNGILAAGTPFITTLPYVYEAFARVYRLDKDERWKRIMRSIAEHAMTRYRDVELSADTATCAYTPDAEDHGQVINASAYRAYLLTQAAVDFGEPRYQEVATRNLNFVLASQAADGSWPYATDGHRPFIDHFHTCFVLKALVKIERLVGDSRAATAIERGIAYYVTWLFDGRQLPVPFARAPRLTVYRRELYDYAECINLAVLLRGRFPELDRRCLRAVTDLLIRWQKADGSFRSRELKFGWDSVPMHRWAQAQAFRSLSVFLASRLHGTEH